MPGGMVLAEFLAHALAKYQEDEPWETLPNERRERHRRLGELLALELRKLSDAHPSPSPTPADISLSRDQAVEVSVAVPLTVGGQTGVLSPESVQDIFKACLERAQQGGQHARN